MREGERERERERERGSERERGREGGGNLWLLGMISVRVFVLLVVFWFCWLSMPTRERITECQNSLRCLF